jgi:hypothetical protein
LEAKKSACESGFCEASKSIASRLEKTPKIPIFSVGCEQLLCARRSAPFMAERYQSAPDFAPLIRDILEGLT